jgi:hypothetical protein
MPKKIFEGLGPGTLIPQRGTGAVDESLVGPQEGFVLSRVDGHTSLEEILLLVPFDEPVAMIILRRLWEIGAIDVPGVARTMVQRPPAQGSVPAAIPLSEDSAPTAILDDEPKTNRVVTSKPSGVDTPDQVLSPEARRRIDGFFESLETRTAFELLEVAVTADTREIKRAYFRLSKEFHPDRYFGRELGPYADRLSKIFQAVKAAFELLSDPGRRAAYEEAVGLK